MHQLGTQAGGSGWRTDYPGSDNNFSVRLAELRGRHVKLALVDCNYVVVDSAISSTAATVHGRRRHGNSATRGCARDFPLKGGLWVDDFWGAHAWDTGRRNSRILPSAVCLRCPDDASDHAHAHDVRPFRRSRTSLTGGAPAGHVRAYADSAQCWGRVKRILLR
jgi:hypothetical protein